MLCVFIMETLFWCLILNFFQQNTYFSMNILVHCVFCKRLKRRTIVLECTCGRGGPSASDRLPRGVRVLRHRRHPVGGDRQPALLPELVAADREQRALEAARRATSDAQRRARHLRPLPRSTNIRSAARRQV